jgi:zinc transport system substrate-binding protein
MELGSMKAAVRFPVAIIAALCCALPVSSEALADVDVVVTSKPIHALVASVMQGIGTPALLVGGTASPHSYAMKPSDAQKVNTADVFFRVSEALEPFTGKVVASLPKSVRVVSLAEAPGLKLLDRREGGAFEADDHGHGHSHDHAKHDDHDHEQHDPHVWLDPGNAKAMVRQIADVLAEVAPDKAAAIKTNAEAELARIDSLSAELERELKPLAGKPFIVYHDAYQYLENRFGLTAVGSLTVSPDAAPSGRRLRDLRKKITTAKAECVFAEPQFEARVNKSVIEGTKARSGTLDPEGTQLTPGPELYATLMRNLAQNLKSCLAGN